MKYFLVFLTLVAVLHGRLGETREELVARLGKVGLESRHSINALGKITDLGPTLFFVKDPWRIQCNMVNGRCATVAYSKHGDWTAEQISTLLQNNAQGLVWSETKDSTKMIRKWKRSDGGEAKWQFTGTMEFVSSEYLSAKAAVLDKLTAKSQEKPNL